MNERLKEIAIKAQVEHCVSHVRLQEFAELIVKDIADMIECDYKYVNVRNDCVWKTAFEIACKLREQYGIE
jgi:hypothetical protein